MVKFYKILFSSTLMMGTLIAASSYSWFSMWMGLEINLLSIIPLLCSTSNSYSSESAIKYFVTQALASSILLFSIIMIINSTEFAPPNSNYFMMMSLNSSLLMKMGAAPFHFWFPEVMEGLDWFNSMIMLTWQKIAPMVLLMYNSEMMTFLTAIIITSSLVGGILGINQTSLRKLLAYSSINHIGWMIASMMNYQAIWLIYFCVYSAISINIILILNHLNIFYVKQLVASMTNNKLFKFLLIMNFLSLGGLPPFLGFFPKWMTINYLAANKATTLSLILIILTLVTLFFYIRLTFSSLVLGTDETLMNKPSKFSFSIVCANILILLAMITCFLMINLN